MNRSPSEIADPFYYEPESPTMLPLPRTPPLQQSSPDLWVPEEQQLSPSYLYKRMMPIAVQSQISKFRRSRRSPIATPTRQGKGLPPMHYVDELRPPTSTSDQSLQSPNNLSSSKSGQSFPRRQAAEGTGKQCRYARHGELLPKSPNARL